MFERFLSKFSCDDDVALPTIEPTLDGWLDSVGARSFDNGLYRVHSQESSRTSDALVWAAFPEFRRRVRCFGYDWLGRQFAIDGASGTLVDPEVLMFEPGTGEVLEIPVGFSRFHDEELVDFGEEALAQRFYSQWLESGGRSPDLSECVGYRTPLFLGGVDLTRNLELTDLDVYWTICGQLRIGAATLPEGASILKVVRDG